MTLTDAQLNLITFVDDHYTSLIQALEAMAERNDATAKTWQETGAPNLARTFSQSAAAWRAMASTLSQRWEAAFPGEEE